jgi:hypothetical protein
MAIIYRGRVTGSYYYWTEDQSTPIGATNITVVNVPVLTASHVDRSVYAPAGISGSLQRLTGSQAYLIAGPNITITTNSLGQVAITGSAGGGGSFGTLQQTYDAGIATIGINNSTGSFVMSGGLTPIGLNFPPLMRLEPGKNGPYATNFSAIDVYGYSGGTSASLINIRTANSTGGDAQIMMRSSGGTPSKITWFSGAGELYGSTGTAQIYYHPTDTSLYFEVAGSGQKYTMKDGSGNSGTGNVAEFINATTSFGGTIKFFTGANTSNAIFINSGSFEQSGSATFKNNVIVTGSVTSKLGFSGSLTKLTDGSSYIIAGTGINVASASNGAITISSTGGGGGDTYWQSTTNNIAFTTGSIAVTGSVTLGVDGAGRGLLRVGTLDISPITGSAATTVAINNVIVSGSVLSASNGVWNGNAVALRHEFHILGIGYDSLGNLNQFTATYLISTHINAAGSQTAIQNGLTEMSRETTGSFASGWDVNVNTNCSLAVTGATDTGIVYWYVQRTKEMGLRSDGTRI